MHIRNVQIGDIKCFAGHTGLDLPGPGTWTVFAGRNGAGKTTLLRSIAATVAGPVVARSLMGDRVRWVRIGAPFGFCATLLGPQTTTDEFATGVPEQLSGRPMPVLMWEPSTNQSTDQLVSCFPPNSGLAAVDKSLLPVLDQRSPLNTEVVTKTIASVNAGPWSLNPKGWFIAAYGAHRHLGPASKDIQDRSAGDPVYARLINLFSEAATLSEAVDWLKNVHLRALENKPGAAELKEGALRFLGQGLLPDGSAVVRIDSDGLWIRRDGEELPLEHVSDGYRTVTALVLDLLRQLHRCYGELALELDGVEDAGGHWVCPKPGVVLIDEVDAHLHIEWQQRIGFWLRRHFPQIQFLVTTHSPFICQAASPGGLIRLPGPGEDRKMEVVSEALHRTITMGGADAAVLTELFGLDSPRSKPAEDARDALAAIELRMLRGQATEADRSRHAELKAMLPDDLDELSEQSLRALGLQRGRE
jgi:hypothetical protein